MVLNIKDTIAAHILSRLEHIYIFIIRRGVYICEKPFSVFVLCVIYTFSDASSDDT